MSCLRVILAILFPALALTAFSQDHMKFMGLPIDGQLTTFCQALEKKNLQLDKMYANSARYEGLFTGRLAYMIVETTPKTHTVCDVLVAYQDHQKWDDMDNLYFGLKEQLTTKYGEPKDVLEVGDAPISDSFIEDNLENASLIRRARFETEVGYIDLGIDNLRLFAGSYGSPYAYLIYIDKANQAKCDQEAFDDL